MSKALDLISRAERRGHWFAVEVALYLSQILARKVARHTVTGALKLENLKGFVVEEDRPVHHVGIEPDSVDTWIERFTGRARARKAGNSPPPAAHLTVAEVAERLRITRKEAWQMVYVEESIPSVEWTSDPPLKYAERWTFPVRLVQGEQLEEWAKGHLASKRAAALTIIGEDKDWPDDKLYWYLETVQGYIWTGTKWVPQ